MFNKIIQKEDKMKIHICIYTTIIIVFGFISCNLQSKEDVEFKQIFYNNIDEIIAYDKKMSKIGPINEEDWVRFYEVTSYMSFLTGCKFHYIAGEPPVYLRKSDVKADVKFLKKWYENNKNKMSISIADSIVNMKYDSLGGGVIYYKGMRYEGNVSN